MYAATTRTRRGSPDTERRLVGRGTKTGAFRSTNKTLRKDPALTFEVATARTVREGAGRLRVRVRREDGTGPVSKGEGQRLGTQSENLVQSG